MRVLPGVIIKHTEAVSDANHQNISHFYILSIASASFQNRGFLFFIDRNTFCTQFTPNSDKTAAHHVFLRA